MWTPPPDYQSRAPTPAPPPMHLAPRLSCSTTTSGSASRFSNGSFETWNTRSSRSSLDTLPCSHSTQDRLVVTGIVEVIDEEVGEDEHDSDDSPIDPRQVIVAPRTAAAATQSYLYFSPLIPSGGLPSPPARARPSAPTRTTSNSPFYPYPIDYGESHWQVEKSDATIAREPSVATKPPSGQIQDQLLRESPTALARLDPTSNSTERPPLKSCLKRPHRSDSLDANAILSIPPEPFRPTSPLSIPKTTSIESTSSLVSPSLSVATCTTSSSVTVTPSSLSLTPTPSRISRSFSTSVASRPSPQRIWSARTNRYIYIHAPIMTLDPPSAASTRRRSLGTSASSSLATIEQPVSETHDMVEVPQLPYVTRPPLEPEQKTSLAREADTFEIEEETRGRSRTRSRSRK
ncbi:uncharacterized protein JCM15063_000280 [Sporobolomyces koalae]|uniref:uncharacterized protein n=1 Tax=Sporobolomyces koalae TaxID=500713 RepID=UPI00316B0FF1